MPRALKYVTLFTFPIFNSKLFFRKNHHHHQSILLKLIGSEFKEVGCFKDVDGDRAFPQEGDKVCEPGAADKCMRQADAKGFNVFGLQYPQDNCSQCWFGSDEAKAKGAGSSDKCEKNADREGLGAPWANSVYVVERKNANGSDVPGWAS
jgi:hypothetical protein